VNVEQVDGPAVVEVTVVVVSMMVKVGVAAVCVTEIVTLGVSRVMNDFVTPAHEHALANREVPIQYLETSPLGMLLGQLVVKDGGPTRRAFMPLLTVTVWTIVSTIRVVVT
jgi:hypothetical protein